MKNLQFKIKRLKPIAKAIGLFFIKLRLSFSIWVFLLLVLSVVKMNAQKITGISATASSGNASLAVDNNTNTRWESAFSDPQWIMVDLGTEYNVSKVIIRWEAANARDYTLEGSVDGNSWTLINSFTNMGGGNRIDEIAGINQSYRYIKMNGTARNLNYGYSIWEFEVYQVAAPVLNSIEINPKASTILKGQTQLFTCIGKDQNGDPFPLTAPTTWAVDDTINAQIDSNGLFIATYPGLYTITATNDSFIATTTIDVLPLEANIAPEAKIYTSSGNGLLAIDNNQNSRWESAFSDPQWIMIDFGRIRRIFGFRIDWEAANAKNYLILASKDSSSWDTLAVKTNMPTGNRTDRIFGLSHGDYRFIMIYGISRNLAYGYSIWEWKIYETTKIQPDISWNNPASIIYGTPIDSSQLNAAANVTGTFIYWPAAGSILNAGKQWLYVTFIPDDDLTYKPVTDSVEILVNKAIPQVVWNTIDSLTYGTSIDSTILSATANIEGTFNYSVTAGTILNAGTNQINLTFIPADTSNYETISLTKTIIVRKANPVIIWENPADITYGNRLSDAQLNASVVGITGTFVYNYSINTLLNAGTYQLKVQFLPNDTLNYNSVFKSVVLIVRKASPVITWVPQSLTFGEALSSNQLNAVANVVGTFIYSDTIGHLFNAGIYTLSLNFVPQDTTNYLPTETTVQLLVKKAKPIIVWNNPADIDEGTPLSEQQLNATANIDGVFVYEPQIGTILNAGSGQKLKVTFYPVDSANYEVVSKEVLINVNLVNKVSLLGNNDFYVYPNPFNNWLNIKASTDYQKAIIYDILGKPIKEIELLGNLKQINTADLKAGTYIIQLIGTNKLNTLRILKK